MELVQIIKALADENRLRILSILRFGALCVCEIEEILQLSQSNASRHLNKLMNVKLVTYYKDAKYVYYKLDQETLVSHPFVKELLDNELDKYDRYREDYLNTKSSKEDGFSCEYIEKSKVTTK